MRLITLGQRRKHRRGGAVIHDPNLAKFYSYDGVIARCGKTAQPWVRFFGVKC